ncbi:uncharacterized protein LOC129777483 isoform X2 [Toxorhynchites rutilus septentrionalis]|uniref:uncharacterized protein LOC129777483 isoform X2 n=1 Tax=Toxorhynchites rutilus septentrionalis TaxID=329112 RepID=UPI00247AED0B|nr:uncharacterized protein LOC129777483 isoform X2 [Toxorhynchites rutilus septentrionalis]
MSGFWRESDVSASDDSDADNSPDGGDRSVAGKSTLEDLSSRKIVGDEIEPQNVGRGITAAKWLSGSWPLKSFDENLPLNKRKAEWIRFRNQFERIVACKEPVGSTMKLDGLKIFAGNYLLSVIEAHGNLPADSGNIYDATVSALNRYFEQTCDCTKERMKFREMRMGTSEPFVDWVLRLETQAKFCEFEADQRVEEFIQALVRRSVPQIATKLYEMSDVFNNNLERITAYGRHLDYIRTEAEESKHITKDESGNRMDEMNSHEGTVVKPVNAVAGRSSAFGQIRQGFHREVRSDADGNRFSSGRAGRFKNVSQSCSRCGSIHGPKKCLAYRVKCYTCGREGHFAAFCFFKDGSANGGPRGGHWRSGRDRMVKQEVERINQCDRLQEYTRMAFEPRSIVNGSLLKRYSGQPVSIHLFVERSEKNGRSFTGRSTDEMPVHVILNEPLSSILRGWVEVIGMAGSNDSIQCKEIITYQGTEGEEDFDTNGHNMLCTLLANCRDIYRVG